MALKVGDDLLSDAGGRVWRNENGSIALGTCGFGDVLAGIIAGLAARGASALDATLWSVFVHAQIGACLSKTVAALGFLARDLLPEVHSALERIAAS